MKKIGILAAITTLDIDIIEKVAQPYVDMIAKENWLPIIIPHQEKLFEEYIKICDGFVFIGGSNDCTPQIYQAQNTHSKGCNLSQDKEELQLMSLIEKSKKPLLGICRGMQLMNIYFGGSLIQDVTNSQLHCQYTNQDISVHSVTINESRYLPSGEYNVNSVHHQAVQKIGSNLLITSTSEDGIIESLEHKTLPWIGVQWHPEFGFLDKECTSVF